MTGLWDDKFLVLALHLGCSADRRATLKRNEEVLKHGPQ